jgi:NHLM bacteriocin system ABC transporter ATP-binding protein
MSGETKGRRTSVGSAATARDPWSALMEGGVTVPAAGNRPLSLQDDRLAWLVIRGPLHVFAVRSAGGDEPAARAPLFRVDEGDLLLGTGRAGGEAGLHLVASGGPESAVVQIEANQVLRLVLDSAGGAQLLAWIESLTTAAAAAAGPEPRDADPLQAGEQRLAAGSIARAGEGLVWLRTLAGSAHFLGRDSLPLTPDLPAFPLSPSGWLVASEALRLVAGEAVQPASEPELAAGLELFHARTLGEIRGRVDQVESGEAERLARSSESDRRHLVEASWRLARSFDPHPPAKPEAAPEDPLLAACRLIGEVEGFPVAAPNLAEAGDRGLDPLEALARASRIRTRRVRLSGDWWRREQGPLLGYVRRDGALRPVAVLPAPRSGYVLAEPDRAERPRLDARLAGTLEQDAHVLYRPFPERPVNARQLLAFSFRDAGRDLAMMGLYGLLGGLLALALPLITAPLFNEILPTGNQPQLLLAVVALTITGLATGALQIARGVVQVRAEGRADTSLQSALWDRLLKLPAPFFRRYTAGDLANRAMGLTNLRQILTGTVSTSVLTGVFSLFSFVLLFFYNVGLALVAVALVAVGLGLSFALIGRQLRTLRALNLVQNRLAGITLQFLTGMAKIRVAGAEPRAYAVWAENQSEQSRLSTRAQFTTIRINVILSALPLASTMLIFGAFSLFGAGMQTGTFIAFTTAFTQGLAAMLGLGMAAVTLAQTVPLYESARPILAAMPEVSGERVHPGALRGDIELTGLGFRYLPEAPLVLDDVSVRVRLGQFLALVGPSGSGKSTIMRLLLGFETPESGSIHYDGHDLATLDLQAVRRQLGVVLQSSRVFPGSVLQNIVGTSTLTLDDAWEAAGLAGLDEDIRAMPMGMQTFIVEGGSTLSGGQRQRLLIARAIVQRPRILLFDEATSALDNETQAIVSQALEALRATRIVIAHRLSTIMHADRIVVLVDGRIVQSGVYEELLAQSGQFQELARRQVL